MNIKGEKKVEEEISQYRQNLWGEEVKGKSKCDGDFEGKGLQECNFPQAEKIEA